MQDIKAIVTRVVVRVMRPLVRVLLRYELSHSEFAEIAKRVYVDVAYRHYGIPGRKQTHSRISVITGIPRKEVVRLSEIADDAPVETKGPLNRAARVISGWMRDPDFAGADDKPKVLALYGETDSFESLVARYSGDITARAILDELIRVGAVEKPTKETVKLTDQGYIPQAAPAEKLTVMADCVSDLLSTSTHNLDPGLEGSRFQRQVAYANLPESVIREFKEYSHDKSLELLIDFNKWLAQKEKDVPPKPGEPVGRVGVGIYFFRRERSED